MSLRSKMRHALAMRRADLWLFGEAAIMLALARVLLAAIPFRVLARAFAKYPENPATDEETCRRVRRAVMLAARNVPFRAVCLPQAMAAKAMLARRGCGSAMHFGAAVEPNGKLVAHAWLVAAGKVVVGEDAITTVQPLARFG